MNIEKDEIRRLPLVMANMSSEIIYLNLKAKRVFPKLDVKKSIYEKIDEDIRENLDDLEDKIAVITERKVHLNFRKTGRKEMGSDQIRKWDLSKINFDNIEYKK